MLGCTTVPPMPFNSAFLTRLISCTLVYGLSFLYTSESLVLALDEELEELELLECFLFRDLLLLRRLRSFSFLSLCRLRLLSSSLAAFSFFTLAFFSSFSTFSFFVAASRLALLLDTGTTGTAGTADAVGAWICRGMQSSSASRSTTSCLTLDCWTSAFRGGFGFSAFPFSALLFSRLLLFLGISPGSRCHRHPGAKTFAVDKP
mmetsp:Transcript_11723/g.26159  ORF Transcript_11723/g.26159 Transcript_11723/m.26159 type:complete len:204 (+) Transcript_11723:378-989(+)